MCVKLPPGDLNPYPYPSHPTSTYTCGVTIAPRVQGCAVALKMTLESTRKILESTKINLEKTLSKFINKKKLNHELKIHL